VLKVLVGKLNSPRFAMLRYGVVGLINITVDAGGFAILVTWFNAPASVANVISFSCGIVTSYTLNSRWTFRDRHEPGRDLSRFTKFVLINIAGLLLSTTLVVTFALFMDKVVAKIASIPIVFFYNYFASRHLVFRVTNKAPIAAAEVNRS
jgi:putative flippase GtrA